MKRAIVVVTYNRQECLIQNLMLLRQQTVKPDVVYVINNASSDGTKEYLQQLAEQWEQLQVINLEENIGGAGGFYTGIQVAIEEGADCVWGMDDDAYPHPDAFEQLLKVAETDKYQNVYWSNCDEDKDFNNGVKEVPVWMFVGFLVTKKAVEAAGMPKKEYFIYHDDVEYAYRLRRKGFHIYKVEESRISHKDMVSDSFYKKQIGKWTLQYPKLSSWKNYYYIRNYIFRYDEDIKNKLKFVLVSIPWFFIKLCIVKLELLPSFLKGAFHGIFRITGIKERP